MRATLGLLLCIGLATGAASVRADQTLVDVKGFESYNIGPVAGQTMSGDGINVGTDPVWTAPTAGAGLPGTIVTDTTGGGHGKVLSLDPVGTSGGDVSGAYLPFGNDVVSANGLTGVAIDFDQYRTRSLQSLLVSEQFNPALSSWVGYEYGPGGINGTQQFYPTGDPGSIGVPINEPVNSPEAWHHLHIVLDYNTSMVSAFVDGTAGANYADAPYKTGPLPFTFPYGNRLTGIGFQVSGGNVQGTPVWNYIDNVFVTGIGGTNPIPEPSSAALLVSGLLACAPLARRRKA